MKTSPLRTLAALAPAAVLLMAPAVATDSKTRHSATRTANAPVFIALRNENAMPKTEAEFLAMTWTAGATEMKLSDLAAGKASREEVRELGRSLSRDHRAMNKQIEGVADQIAAPLPSSVDNAATDDVYLRLEKKEGAAFDALFLKEMEASHARGIRRFMTATVIAKEPPVKNFIAENLPVLRQHLALIRSIPRK